MYLQDDPAFRAQVRALMATGIYNRKQIARQLGVGHTLIWAVMLRIKGEDEGYQEGYSKGFADGRASHRRSA